MALELRQQLKLSQQLVMTPQLQQAIKLLQLSRMELVNLVQKELQENPVLEEEFDGEDGADAAPEDAGSGDLSADAAETSAEREVDFDAGLPEAPMDASDAGDSADRWEAGEVPGESLTATGDAAPAAVEAEPSHADKVADVDWQDYMEAYPQTGMREVREDDRSFEATATRRETLAEHLEWQLHLCGLDASELAIAELIVGNLDESGFLQASVEEIARQGGVDEVRVVAVLARVQELDPPGVAARDLRECLLVQAKALGITDSLVLRILSEQLDPLIQRDFRGVARALSVTIEEVAAAARVIGTLEPRPGRAFGGDDPIYIVPDIYVHRIGDDFHIVLNDDGLPRLRVSHLYREVMAKNAAVPKDTKNYVHDKVRSAVWLIKSIHQRQRTIFRVMESILRHQREFFEHGINFLKPLNLRDVAEDIGMHESTVSRVTTNKYVHTPQGIFELKYFFNSSISRVEGDAVASESVKERIAKLIRNEDPRRPLSDQRIAEMLRRANIDIARRTVTKYREALNILSSTKRREVG
jgi:RNA polymerase sigma-54 factor